MAFGHFTLIFASLTTQCNAFPSAHTFPRYVIRRASRVSGAHSLQAGQFALLSKSVHFETPFSSAWAAAIRTCSFFVNPHLASKPLVFYRTFQTPRISNPIPGTARALPREVEIVENVNPTQLLGYHGCTAVVRTAVLLCCRCGLVGTYCSTAVVMLWCVGRWVGGGWWVLGGWRLARDPRNGGGRKTTNLFAFLTVLYLPMAAVLKTPEPTKCFLRTGIPPYILLHCCTAVVAWSVGGGGARGWVERVVYSLWVCFRGMALLFCFFIRTTLISI